MLEHSDVAIVSSKKGVAAVASEGEGGAVQESLPADVALWFLGTRPVTSVVEASFPGSLDDAG